MRRSKRVRQLHARPILSAYARRNSRPSMLITLLMCLSTAPYANLLSAREPNVDQTPAHARAKRELVTIIAIFTVIGFCASAAGHIVTHLRLRCLEERDKTIQQTLTDFEKNFKTIDLSFHALNRKTQKTIALMTYITSNLLWIRLDKKKKLMRFKLRALKSHTHTHKQSHTQSVVKQRSLSSCTSFSLHTNTL